MLFKHVVLDGLDSVAVLENARANTLVEASKVAKSHQGLKILQALAFSVQEKSNGSHLIRYKIIRIIKIKIIKTMVSRICNFFSPHHNCAALGRQCLDLE